MTKDETRQMWDDRIREVAEEIQHVTDAGTVLVAVFDGPWMDGGDPAVMGLIGTRQTDPFRVARDLRIMAATLEKHAPNIARSEPFSYSEQLPKPVRD